MVRSSGNAVVNSSHKAAPPEGLDLRLHILAAALMAAVGFIIMISTGFGVLLFAFGLCWLLITKARLWWRKQESKYFR
jgi:hypothetical protein